MTLLADIAQPSLVPVEEFVYSGLKKRIEEVFGVPAVICNATDEIQLLKRLRDVSNNEVTYPYIFLSISTQGINKEGYRPRPMARSGVVTQVQGQLGQFVYVMRLLPTSTVFDVRYFDNDHARLMKFVKRWLFACQSGVLKYTVEYGRALDIAVFLEDNLTVPKREADPNNIPEHELTTQLTVNGYLSEDKPILRPLVKEVQVELATTDAASGSSSVFMSFPVRKDTTQ